MGKSKGNPISKVVLAVVLALILYVSNFAGLIPGDTVKADTITLTPSNISTELTAGAKTNEYIITQGNKEYKLDGDFRDYILGVTSSVTDITLDLNGNNLGTLWGDSDSSITVNGNDKEINYVTVLNGANFTLNNVIMEYIDTNGGTVTQNGGYVNYQFLLRYGGTYNLDSSSFICCSRSATINDGNFNMIGGTIQRNFSMENGYFRQSSGDIKGDFTMSDGTFCMNNGGNSGNFTISGGSFTMENGTIYGDVAVSGTGSFTQNNGSIKGSTPTTGFTQKGGTRAGAYTIAFDLNGSGGSNPSSITTTKKVINTNVVDVLASLPNEPTWEGHNFQGWYTQRDGGEQVSIDSTTFNASTTLYAHWGQSGNGSGTVTPGTPTPSTTPAPAAPTVSEPETDDSTSDDSSSGDYLDELYTVLDNAVTLAADGKPHTIYWNEGTALPYSVMKTLADNPKITLVFSYVYQGVPYIITIPGSSVVVDPGIPWYGPLYLNAVYGKVKAPDPTGNTQTSTGTYSVKAGDTLSAIAARLGTSIKHLQELNHIKDPDKIKPGQVLKY